MTTIIFFKDFLFIAFLLWSAFSGIFLEKPRKRLQEKNTNMILYGIGSIGGALLIILYYLLEQYKPNYIDLLFFWIWIPSVCLCFLMILESRFQFKKYLCYHFGFLRKETRIFVLLAGVCLGMLFLIWYGSHISQMIFRPESYQPVSEEDQWQTTENPLKIGKAQLSLPWMIEGDYVTTSNKKQEKIVPFSKKKLYFQFSSKKQLIGEDLHLELLHHGNWYRLKEKETIKGTRPSQQQWTPRSAEQYYELDLNVFQGLIPGYYRLCMTVEAEGDIDISFWIK